MNRVGLAVEGNWRDGTLPWRDQYVKDERAMRMAELQAGWDVVGNDGHKLGTIREVGQHYVLVSTGHFSESLYVPASAIGNVERDVVRLSVTVRDAGSMGWEQPPREEDVPQGQQSDLHRHV